MFTRRKCVTAQSNCWNLVKNRICRDITTWSMFNAYKKFVFFSRPVLASKKEVRSSFLSKQLHGKSIANNRKNVRLI